MGGCTDISPVCTKSAELGCDQRLNKAARAEGLIVFDPETDSQADLDKLLPP